MDACDDRVRFRIGDVFAPPAEEVLDSLFGGRILAGRIVGETMHDEGIPCVVVAIEGLVDAVIVPRHCLIGA